MEKTNNRILIWPPSPMGDAILCTPALRAIRERYKSSPITFYARKVVKEVIEPCKLNDLWILQTEKNPLNIAKQLRQYNFTHAILFKNSFASALAVRLAGIPNRIGYSRDGRGLFLTDKLFPEKLSIGKYKPVSQIDYNLKIAEKVGADISDRSMELCVEPKDKKTILAKYPELLNKKGPIVILVPGGAYGPSKLWLSERFAQTADRLIERYKATVFVSVAPDPQEKKIAKDICRQSKNKLINLGEDTITLGQLKALIEISDLVITNDTGPRHIAIALKRKLVTLFGPNDPAWTESDYQKEIQIQGKGKCVPCRKPECKAKQHYCMESITTDMVYEAAKQLLKNSS